ncbi:NAD(P)H-binding protein [Lentzea sp. NPDC051838]|uniref:SDR family oxidoreductase n=1 Tax=Lentzea sp. NPDC051838 TaxID=3154849 RepID=UPI003438FD8C
MRFLVTGGTGRLGSLVADRLRHGGHDVRITSRRTGLGLYTVDWKTGAGLAEAVDGVDVVVHCAAANGDVEMERALVEACAGVSHLVYISIVGTDRIPIKYYRMKVAAEELISQSGIPYTILRATQFHDLVRSVLAVLAKCPLLMPVPELRFQSVDVTEVAERLAALAVAEPAGRVPELGGPEVVPLRELALQYLASTGRHRRLVSFRLPGKAFGGFKAGHHLTPAHADGRITFAEFLAAEATALRR